jgi:hypothetical protein
MDWEDCMKDYSKENCKQKRIQVVDWNIISSSKKSKWICWWIIFGITSDSVKYLEIQKKMMNQ